MTQTSLQKPLSPADVGTLCDLLGQEEQEYRRLLRLAWRQSGYLRRQDVPRLEKNAEQWQMYLPQADAARIKREAFIGELAGGRELVDERPAPQLLLDRADNMQRQTLNKAVGRLLEAVGDLNRQNEMNRQLADFCLELTREEGAIFKRGVLEDPAGCYEDDAKKSQAPPGKVIIRRA